MDVATLNRWFFDLLHQVRETLVYYVPADALPKAVWLGAGMAVIGLLLGVFGAHFARGIISVLLGGAGIIGGVAVAHQFGVPKPIGGLVGLVALAAIGFFAHRMWVGMAVGLLACSLGVFMYARQSFWEEWTTYQPVPARTAEHEFEVPAEQAVETTPWAYVRGFYDYLSTTRPDVSKKAVGLAALSLIAGFAWGMWFTRGALIVATALIGTLLFTAGMGAVVDAVGPAGWDGRIAQHPKLSLGFLMSCFLLSALVQYRFTQQPKSSPAQDQPKP